TQMSTWGAFLAGATIIIHGAGWMEGGLTVSYEKLITDLETMQIMAELCTETSATKDDIALSALSEVQPGGHFFGASHTMERYQSAFYEPLVADWSNFGTWTERGALDASARATAIWQGILEGPPEFIPDRDRAEALSVWITKRKAEGGAPPES
ncbi:MAG: trimethylamine methyltransferase family protein, partial [Pseudomonadota bacterium]